MTPNPIWPALVLAVIQAADAMFCAVPLRFVTECLNDVGLPDRYRPALPPIKAAAATGLLVGVWVPYLAAITSACLVVYFVLAVGAHLRARDIGRNMVNASALLVFSAVVVGGSI